MNLALFDLDGTITKKDTFLEFIRYAKGDIKFFSGLLIMSPILVLMKLKLIANWKAKEIFFGYFFKGDSEEQFNKWGQEFADKKLPALVRKTALARIHEHKASNDKIYVVSASSEVWLKSWCLPLGIELITTRWEIKDGKVTGKLEGLNCYGPEKKNRIHACINLKEYKTVHVYGDSRGDTEMLSLATHPNYRVFGD